MRPRDLLVLALVVLVCSGASWAELNEAGKSAYARGQYHEAERRFREAIAAAPDEPELHYHRGVALTHLHRWVEAAAAYEKALALRPSSSLATRVRQALSSVEPMIRSRPASPAPEPEVAPRSRPSPRRVELPPETVRVRRMHGNWYVDVTLNDMQQATFLVDTGASACFITAELAAAIGIVADPDAPVVRVQGIAGSTWGRRVKIASIRAGETEAQDVTAYVIPLPGMQGILGNTFLARYIATFDPARGLLTLQPR